MKVSLSPWARDRLGPAAIEALRAAPDEFQLSVSRGKSGYGATLIRRTRIGYDLLADVNGYAEPSDAIAAVMEAARPHPKAVA